MTLSTPLQDGLAPVASEHLPTLVIVCSHYRRRQEVLPRRSQTGVQALPSPVQLTSHAAKSWANVSSSPIGTVRPSWTR